MPDHHKEIAILYHGGCPDGFGGAYAAWKKFGDTADYIPVKHGKPAPSGLAGKKLYFVDFCYPKDIMNALIRDAASVTVLDHHLGNRDVVESMPEYVFDEKHSGATIAWAYFHPEIPVPTLLKYVEEGDLYRFGLPHSREILSYVYTLTDSFASFDAKNVEKWNTFITEIENPVEFARMVETGTLFSQYHEHVVVHGVNHAELVHFEGYECYLTGASGEFVSDIGNRLARLKPPIAIIVSADAEGLRVSLRSDKSVDVAALARKYGGNGHPAAAGFEIPFGVPPPWTLATNKHENPRN